VRVLWALGAVGCSFQPSKAIPSDAHPLGDAVSDGARDGAPPPDAAIIAPVLADKGTASGNSDVVTATLNGTVPVGDVLVVLVTWGGAASLVGVSDSRGTSFTMLVTQTNGLACQLWWGRVGSTTVPDSVQAQFSGTITNRITVADYTGVPQGGALFDGSAAIAIASNSTQVSASIVTAVSNDTLVGIVNSAGTPSAGSGFTAEEVTAFSMLEDRVAATPGDYTAGATYANMNNSCMGLIAVEGVP
jgi:hypothetical protein